MAWEKETTDWEGKWRDRRNEKIMDGEKREKEKRETGEGRETLKET